MSIQVLIIPHYSATCSLRSGEGNIMGIDLIALWGISHLPQRLVRLKI
jgi:hypothetical protein